MRSITPQAYINRYREQPSQKLSNDNQGSHISFNSKLLLFLAFTLIFRITILVRRRSADDFAVVDEFAMIEIVAVGLTLLFLLFSPNLKQLASRLSKSASSILFVYCLVSIISALWSPLSRYTLFRSVQVVSQIFVIFVVLFEFGNFVSAEKFVLRAAAVLMFINLLGQFKLVKFNYSLAALHSNTYSNSAAMLFCYSLPDRFYKVF